MSWRACSGFKKYFAGAEASITCDNVDATTTLGCSKVFSVQNSPRYAIPEFDQCANDRSEIFPIVAVEQPGNIFKNKPRRAATFNKPRKFEEKS